MATYFSLPYLILICALVYSSVATQNSLTNESCANSEDCLSKGLGKLSRCHDGKCQCYDTLSEGKPQRAIYDSAKKICVVRSAEENESTLDLAFPFPLIEDECTDAEECKKNVKGPVQCTITEEDRGTFCKCETEYVSNYNRSQCVPDGPPEPLPPPLIGEGCEDTIECQKEIKGPVQCKDRDANKVCQCDLGFIANSNRRECVDVENTTVEYTTVETTTVKEKSTAASLVFSSAIITFSTLIHII